MKYECLLKQRSRKGSIKQLYILVEDGSNIIYREWGLVGRKQQSTQKEVSGKNIGKANETSPHKQAVIEAQAIVTRKIHEGYKPADELDNESDSPNQFTFYPLASSFTPSKPINDPPEGVSMQGGYSDYFWERKNNGVNLLLVLDEDQNRYDYTRGIKEITSVVSNIPPIQRLHKVPLSGRTILSYELIYYDKDGIEVPKMLRGIVNERTTAEKARERYDELIKDGGSFAIKVFDVLFYDGQDVTGMDYRTRRNILSTNIWITYPEYRSLYGAYLNPGIVDYAKQHKWEGFVLRKLTGPESTIEYTMNGKPYRRGAWKLKFIFTDDYFIYEAKVGTSGRLLGGLAKFHLGKFDDEGNVVPICWAGPGNITGEAMDELTKLLGCNPSEMEPDKPYATEKVVVEVKFSSKQYQSNALEHPVIREIRMDKPASECLISDEGKAA